MNEGDWVTVVFVKDLEVGIVEDLVAVVVVVVVENLVAVLEEDDSL
jgi:hypothetical protein